MSQDYIFCPLCGGVKWITDKTGYADGGRLTLHKCSACKNFIYTDHTELVKHPVLVGVTKTTRYSVQADIRPYRIIVQYHHKTTQFQDVDTHKLILEVNSAVAFNWYKNEELVDKIKKYVVFS